MTELRVADLPVAPTTLIRVCRLAEGGMGRVDLAVRRAGTFERLYAVKRLHPHLASDPDFRGMFLDEARIAGLIRHPNVVGVLDVGEDEQGPFLVMDYIDGLPLGNLIGLVRGHGDPMPVQIALRIALDVARGLHAAHELSVDGHPLGLVHRDLSPQNVMVGFDGGVRLTDFGIAKALGRATRTATGVIKGKMSYLAPEQLLQEEPDRRSDLFSLGIVIFEMLSGERLYRGENGKGDLRAILEDPPPDIGELRSDVPDALVQLLFELLSKKRDARPSDAQEVANRLEAILAELLAAEAAASVAEYVELTAGEVRREQAEALRASMEGLAAASAPASRAIERGSERGTKRPARGAIVAAVVLVAGASIAIAAVAWSRRDTAGNEEIASDVASEVTSGVARSNDREAGQPETSAERAPSSDVDVAAHAAETPALDASGRDPIPGTAEPAGPAASEPRAARRHPARRPRRGARSRASAADRASLPDWVEFEQ